MKSDVVGIHVRTGQAGQGCRRLALRKLWVKLTSPDRQLTLVLITRFRPSVTDAASWSRDKLEAIPLFRSQFVRRVVSSTVVLESIARAGAWRPVNPIDDGHLLRSMATRATGLCMGVMNAVG